MSPLELKGNFSFISLKSFAKFFFSSLWDLCEFAEDNKFNFGVAFKALNAAEVQGAIALLLHKCSAGGCPHPE